MDISLPQHILPSFVLLLARLCQLVTSNDDTATSIWSFLWIQDLPLRRLPQIAASNTHLARASSFIRTIWPNQRSRWILLRCTTSMSLKTYSPVSFWKFEGILWMESRGMSSAMTMICNGRDYKNFFSCPELIAFVTKSGVTQDSITIIRDFCSILHSDDKTPSRTFFI